MKPPRRCPFCRAVYLTGSLPKRFACNRLIDPGVDADRSAIHKECLRLEAQLTKEL